MKPECEKCAEYGSEFCKDCLNEKEIENRLVENNKYHFRKEQNYNARNDKIFNRANEDSVIDRVFE